MSTRLLGAVVFALVVLLGVVGTPTTSNAVDFFGAGHPSGPCWTNVNGTYYYIEGCTNGPTTPPEYLVITESNSAAIFEMNPTIDTDTVCRTVSTADSVVKVTELNGSSKSIPEALGDMFMWGLPTGYGQELREWAADYVYDLAGKASNTVEGTGTDMTFGYEGTGVMFNASLPLHGLLKNGVGDAISQAGGIGDTYGGNAARMRTWVGLVYDKILWTWSEAKRSEFADYTYAVLSFIRGAMSVLWACFCGYGMIVWMMSLATYYGEKDPNVMSSPILSVFGNSIPAIGTVAFSAGQALMAYALITGGLVAAGLHVGVTGTINALLGYILSALHENPPTGESVGFLPSIADAQSWLVYVFMFLDATINLPAAVLHMGVLVMFMVTTRIAAFIGFRAICAAGATAG